MWHVWERGELQGFGGKTCAKETLKDLGIHRRTILKWIFKKWDGRHGVD
jgi:hypothetical protein